MKLNKIAIIGLFLVFSPGAYSQTKITAAASQELDKPPVHIRLRDMEIRIHGGTNKPLVVGLNNLDGPHTLRCKSTVGCVISIQSEAAIDGIGWEYTLYSTVDGAESSPPYPGQSSPQAGVSMQSTIVGQGTHTVQTVLNLITNESVSLAAWHINYTLYERK